MALPTVNISAKSAGDARQSDGQLMPRSMPYGMRPASTQLLFQADGTPYRSSGAYTTKGDNRTSIDFHNINPYEQVLYVYQASNGFRDNSYLIFFPREEWYQERQKYSLRSVASFKAVVDAMVQPVYEKEILRETSNELFKMFLSNADNTGTTLQDVNETAQTHARMMGVTFIVMDNFVDAASITIQADVLQQRKFPYIYEKMPHEVYKWKCNNWGQLEWITFYDKTDLVPDPKQEGKFFERFYYRRWDNTSWTIYHEEKIENKWNEIREVIDGKGLHGLSYLPIYPVMDYVKSNNLTRFPTPVLADLANMAFVLYNVESWILLLDVYCFPVLTLPPMEGQQIALSVNNAIVVPPDAKFQPSFIAPPTSCLEVLIKSADRLEDKIYKVANQIGISGSAVKQQVSGISKEWDFRASNSLLTKTALASKKLEIWTARTFADYTHTAVDYKVDFPTEFVEAYSQQRLDRAVSLLKEMPPENLAKELWKEVTKVFFDDDPELAIVISDQIDRTYAQKLNSTDELKNADAKAEEDDFTNLINGVLGKFKKDVAKNT